MLREVKNELQQAEQNLQQEIKMGEEIQEIYEKDLEIMEALDKDLQNLEQYFKGRNPDYAQFIDNVRTDLEQCIQNTEQMIEKDEKLQKEMERGGSKPGILSKIVSSL